MGNELTVIPDPDEAQPPAIIEGLTPQQSAFVKAYVSVGDGNGAKAARNAGYALSSATQTAHRLLHQDNILLAIQKETMRRLGAKAPMALQTMVKLMGAKSDFVKQQAAADLLDRAGFKPPDRHQHAVVGGVTIDIRLSD